MQRSEKTTKALQHILLQEIVDEDQKNSIARQTNERTSYYISSQMSALAKHTLIRQLPEIHDMTKLSLQRNKIFPFHLGLKEEREKQLNK